MIPNYMLHKKGERTLSDKIIFNNVNCILLYFL